MPYVTAQPCSDVMDQVLGDEFPFPLDAAFPSND